MKKKKLHNLKIRIHPRENTLKKKLLKKHYVKDIRVQTRMKSLTQLMIKNGMKNLKSYSSLYTKIKGGLKRERGALGEWCHNQRQAKKGNGHNRISSVQIAKLDGIGFDWGPAMAAEQRWDENFEEVRRFRDEHGRWPKKRDGALGRWCGNQRQALKGQGTHRISPAQIARLDGIGFDWGTTRMPWDGTLRRCAGSTTCTGGGQSRSDGVLRNWCITQQQAKKGPGAQQDLGGADREAGRDRVRLGLD